jgi:hypothetical protein
MSVQVLLTPRHLGIVMSYEGGGDLHAYVRHYKLDEVVARCVYMLRQGPSRTNACYLFMHFSKLEEVHHSPDSSLALPAPLHAHTHISHRTSDTFSGRLLRDWTTVTTTTLPTGVSAALRLTHVYQTAITSQAPNALITIIIRCCSAAALLQGLEARQLHPVM